MRLTYSLIKFMQRLLVSVRGPIEAIETAKGGANIADLHKLIKSLVNWQYY